MKENWDYGVLADVVEKASSNISLVNIESDEGEYPVFSAKGLAKRISFFQQKQEYLSVIKDGAGIGRVSKHPAYSSVVATMQYIIPKHGFNIDFIQYFMNSINFEKYRQGSTIPHIYFKDYKNVAFPLVPLPEQKRIVSILDDAFEGIDQTIANTKKIITFTDNIWTSTLASACSGKLTEKWRQNNSNHATADSLLLNAIAQKSEYQKSIGQKLKHPLQPVIPPNVTLPEEWVWASPEQLSFHIVDCPHSTPKWTDEGEVCLRTTNFKAGFLDIDSVRYVSESSYIERTKRLEPQQGDVLYSREGGILGIACVFPPNLKACLGQRMMLFRLNEKVINPEFFASVLNSPYILEIVNNLTAGAAAPHINIRDINTFPIPLPPVTEQTQIVRNLNSVWSSTLLFKLNQLKKLDRLKELKQSILQKAFTGELTADFIH